MGSLLRWCAALAVCGVQPATQVHQCDRNIRMPLCGRNVQRRVSVIVRAIRIHFQLLQPGDDPHAPRLRCDVERSPASITLGIPGDAKFHELFNGVSMIVSCGDVQCRPPVSVHGAYGRTQAGKSGDDPAAVFTGCEVQRGPPIVGSRVHCRAQLDELLHHVHMSSTGCRMQWRLALSVDAVNLRTRADEPPSCVRFACIRCFMQRRAPPIVLLVWVCTHMDHGSSQVTMTVGSGQMQSDTTITILDRFWPGSWHLALEQGSTSNFVPVLSSQVKRSGTVVVLRQEIRAVSLENHDGGRSPEARCEMQRCVTVFVLPSDIGFLLYQISHQLT
mmetsp:Transcript_58189/g.154954  ORF Transcript_58189/g.154954 Transcript_58189/m.154954 type:complete len:332 (+) Transcript_58189:503-1498(+)